MWGRLYHERGRFHRVNNDDAMQMVGHDHPFVEGDIQPNGCASLPFVAGNFPDLRQVHLSCADFAKPGCASAGDKKVLIIDFTLTYKFRLRYRLTKKRQLV